MAYSCFHDTEGEVKLSMAHGRRLDHMGIQVKFFGRIDLVSFISMHIIVKLGSSTKTCMDDLRSVVHRIFFHSQESGANELRPHYDFVSLSKELLPPGSLFDTRTIPFNFRGVEKIHEVSSFRERCGHFHSLRHLSIYVRMFPFRSHTTVATSL